MTKLYRDRRLTDKRLRRKADMTADDPDWLTAQVDPGAFYATTGGTADDGALTVTITPLDTDRYPTPDPFVFTRGAGESLAESAEGLYDAVVAALALTGGAAPTATRYIARVEYTAATQVVRFVPAISAPLFQVTMTGTGGTMTLTLSPDDVFPIVGQSDKHGPDGPSGEAWISVHAVTSADDVLAVGTCTFNMQVLRRVERYDPVNYAELRPGVGDLGTLTGLTLGEEVRVPIGGGGFGVRIDTIANTPATTDALEVRWRDTVT